MNREKVNEWLENTFSDYTKEEDKKESIFYLLKKLQDDNDKEISKLLIDINDAKNEIVKLRGQDRLAELEKIILDYYLNKGYQIGIGSWDFNVEIESDYKSKSLLVYFREYKHDNYSQVFNVETESTKEMFDKAIEWFKTN